MRAWPPKHILVAVDFGEASGRACAVAATIARATGARVSALHAEQFEAPPYFTHEQLDTMEAELKEARSRAADHVREFAATHGLVTPEVTIVEQPAAEAILRAADDADLVLLGSHGRRGPSRWWMGSVSERVARDAKVPVLVVRADDPPATAADLLARANPALPVEVAVMADAAAAPAIEETAFGLRVRTSLDFAAALDRTRSALKAEGFGVLTTIDMQQTLKEKLGRDLRPYTILGACNPPLASRALDAEAEIGLLLPCNVLVYEAADGSILVSAMAPVAALGVVGGNDGLAGVAREADAKLRRALEAVAS
jgi:uncharacterized protein (DUF302 family)/nucleotide-binding universal stress UspA family protein